MIGFDTSKNSPVFHSPKGESEITGGTFIPIYCPNQRFVHLIIGNAGSGKTTLAKNIIKQIQSVVELPSYLVTPLEEIDPSFKGAKLKTIKPEKTISTERKGIDKYQSDLAKYNKMKIIFKHRKKELEPDELMKMELELADLKPDKAQYDTSTRRVYSPAFREIIKQPTLLVFEDADSLKGDRSASELLTETIVHGRHNDINIICILHRPVRNSNLTSNIHECDMITILTDNRLNMKFLGENFNSDLVPIFKRLLKTNRYVTYIRNLNIIIAQCCLIQL